MSVTVSSDTSGWVLLIIPKVISLLIQAHRKAIRVLAQITSIVAFVDSTCVRTVFSRWFAWHGNRAGIGGVLYLCLELLAHASLPHAHAGHPPTHAGGTGSLAETPVHSRHERVGLARVALSREA